MPNGNLRPGATWTSREAYLLALVCLISGLLLGYLFRGSAPVSGPAPVSAGATPPASSAPGAPPMPPSAEALKPMVAPLLAALKADPKSVDTLVQVANLYYDHGVYPEAIEYYTRALELRPNNVNVRTDLGTAFWYGGFPDKAVREYEKSLAVDPSHANTLFNLGVVRLDGLGDSAGAIAAWEKLIQTNPQYPQKQRVLEMIEKARSQKQIPKK